MTEPLRYPGVQVYDNNGQMVTAFGGAASTMAINDGADVAEGATTDAAVITDTTGTVSGKLRGLVKWAFERMPASLGQKSSAASFPVVIASATIASGTSGTGAVQVAKVGNWAVTDHPAAGTLASASKAAGASGTRRVCTAISFTWASDATNNGAAQQVTAVLRDGAAGAGTILAQWTFPKTTTTATDAVNNGSFSQTDLNLVGSDATALTLEFSGTASNHELYCANLNGYDVS